MYERILRGAILNPRPDGSVVFYRDGALKIDDQGRLDFVGAWCDLASQRVETTLPVVCHSGVLVPPFLDAHIHIPQHPIRGRFTEGIPHDVKEGQLLAGLNRNVFPLESQAESAEHAQQVCREFLKDTLSQGVVGGAAYMTVHASAAAIALEELPPTWFVGLVLMNTNCPTYLRTDEVSLTSDILALSERYGPRLIITDRFAVSVTTALRRRASDLAGKLGLRMQTHLNEQITEKALIEEVLYPEYAHYTDVYRQDGLLDHNAILAHCIHMSESEFTILQECGASIAHCPTSNILLGSGVMPLDRVKSHGIPYAICTDVGASPTTSMLCEMAQFLKVHYGRSKHATPQEALFRATLAPAQILGLQRQIGSFAVGLPASFIEIDCAQWSFDARNDDTVIREGLLDSTGDVTEELHSHLDNLAAGTLQHQSQLDMLADDVRRTAQRLYHKVQRVVLHGRTIWERPTEP